MSVSGTAAMAVVRDAAKAVGEDVMKAEVGKAPPESNESASWLDVLTQLIPTGVIAGYSAILTLLVGGIETASADDLEPDRLLIWRIPLWFVFIALTFFLTMRSYKEKSAKSGSAPRRAIPVEAWLSTGAFAAWGAAAPGTWVLDLDSMLDASAGVRSAVPLGIAVIAALVLSGFSKSLQEKLPPPN